jgi:uncharacterized protein
MLNVDTPKPRWGRIGQFYAIAFAGTALAGGLVAAISAGTLLRTAILAVAMFSPALASWLMLRRDGHKGLDGLAALRLSRWSVVAAAVGLAISLLTVLIGALLPGTTWDWQMTGLFETLAKALPAAELQEAKDKLLALPVHPVLLGILQAVIAGCTINAVFAFGEEVGWRGWLQRELAGLPFWRANLLVGTLWGLWHAPIIWVGHNYPDHPLEGTFLFVLTCIGLSPWHAQVRSSGGSVWAAAMLHGTINASAGLSMLVVSGSDLIVGVPGIAGLGALAVANVALLALRSRRPAMMSRLRAPSVPNRKPT